ncbi:ATP-binding protein [Pedobacter sp. JY14-1]|uniref:ATP-binding protein n=1 Tax=Pedobacter sp. JY14-1 TaxID=3034151 RepID=UPI0023E194B5|nr:ATP-binding protein [Pedobacter sp. JY14-1]
MAKSNSNLSTRVSADPAKSFFVSMLIKDITLRDAIGDLVDNSVDAIKARTSGQNDLKGFEITITLDENHFEITDNGFGMEASVARNTAFNFGKSEKHHLIDNSIGQFGIGMKRAFFKIGNLIKVDSRAQTSQFSLSINVEEWLKEPRDWYFNFDKDNLKENLKSPPKNPGVAVSITELSFDSKVSFNDKKFVDTLRKEIAVEHMLNINKGLKILVNGYRLGSTNIDLVYDDLIKPTFWDKVESNRSVKIIAGVSNKSADEGGWYIFCNDRLIVAKDTTDQTVWTGLRGDGVPLWHSQYYRFRGYVFFEAQNSSELPWNTTKTGMDMDSPYYKEVRSRMINMTRQVMDLLDRLKEEKEKDNPEENQTLNAAVEESLKKTTSVLDVLQKATTLSHKFEYPIELFNPAKKSNSVKISYPVSTERFQSVKQHLKVSTIKDVGLATFNYYYDNEL